MKKTIYNFKNVSIMILLLGFIILVANIYNMNYKKINKLKVIYENQTEIKYTNFANKFNATYKIKIKNYSQDVKVYCLKWVGVKNTLHNQNKFLYNIKCTGNNSDCRELGNTQVPSADSYVFTDIYLELYQNQEYIINFIYNGNQDNNASFSGKLVVSEEILDTHKYEEYEKERIEMTKNYEKMWEEQQVLDDK